MQQAVILECSRKGRHASQRYEDDSSPSVWLSGALSNYVETLAEVRRDVRERGRSEHLADFSNCVSALIDLSKDYSKRRFPFEHVPKKDSRRGPTGEGGGSHYRGSAGASSGGL